MFIEATDDGSGGDNWSYKSCESSKQTITTNKPTSSFFTGRMPFLSPNQPCQSTERKISHSTDLLTPNSPGVFQLCLWPLIAPGYLGGGLPCLSSALSCQYPKRKIKIWFTKILFFSSRIVNSWNSLPNNVISAKTINCFKSKFRWTLAKPGRQIWFSCRNHWNRRNMRLVSAFIDIVKWMWAKRHTPAPEPESDP